MSDQGRRAFAGLRGATDSRTHAEYRAAIVAAKKASVAAARKHELLEPVEDVPRAETSTVVRYVVASSHTLVKLTTVATTHCRPRRTR